MHEHHVDRVHPESIVLDIGDDVGALILYTDAELKGHEIEVSPEDNPRGRTHVEVLERRVAGRPVYAGAYPQLPAPPEGARYLIWGPDGAPVDSVDIAGGTVTTQDWRNTGVWSGTVATAP
ncbi:MAG TPA: phospholipase [Chloroflexota bacterium]|nr:phospholipase [Chloroflexota bacterium]